MQGNDNTITDDNPSIFHTSAFDKHNKGYVEDDRNKQHILSFTGCVTNEWLFVTNQDKKILHM